MKFVKITVVVAFAASMLAGCCSNTCAPKCYPYPLYDFSPARVCNNPCTPCAPAPCKPVCR